MAKQKAKKQVSKKGQKPRRWDAVEDQILLDTLRVYGHKGYSKCFIMVSEQIGRPASAVSSHWYCVLSKRKDVWIGSYITENFVTKNRKNGMGEAAPKGVWSKVVKMIQNLFK